MFCFENLNIQNDIKSKSFGGIVKSISMNDLQQITIPIPPLEIQQEIVKILDAFTELNTELKVCESTNKKTLKISEVSEVKNKGMYPVINSGRDLYGYYHDFNNDGENITIASRGEYAGFINYFNEKFFAGGLCYPYKVKDTNELLTKFLYFYLKTNEIQIMENLVFRGSIPALNKADIETLTIPIPPLEIQQEIVKILDQFSALTTDLLAGIPAEIKARKKQYEYYREKLLTFKPLQNKE